MRRPPKHVMQDVGSQPFVPPLRDPALTLCRRLLVNSLFKHVEEIQNLDAGYALRFCRLHDQADLDALIGTIADYIIFESRNAPQLTFVIVEKPRAKMFWLQVRSVEGNMSELGSDYMSFYSSRLYSV